MGQYISLRKSANAKLTSKKTWSYSFIILVKCYLNQHNDSFSIVRTIALAVKRAGGLTIFVV